MAFHHATCSVVTFSRSTELERIRPLSCGLSRNPYFAVAYLNQNALCLHKILLSFVEKYISLSVVTNQNMATHTVGPLAEMCDEMQELSRYCEISKEEGWTVARPRS